MKTNLLICDCNDVSHQIIISYYDDEEVYLEIHLNKVGWWKRLKYAFRYVFGYESKYGSFNSVIMNKSHIRPLENLIVHLKKVSAESKQMDIFTEYDG